MLPDMAFWLPERSWSGENTIEAAMVTSQAGAAEHLDQSFVFNSIWKKET